MIKIFTSKHILSPSFFCTVSKGNVKELHEEIFLKKNVKENIRTMNDLMKYIPKEDAKYV